MPCGRRYETTNHLWLILEYCVGGDLVSLLRQDSKLPESSVHDFGRDLVVALQYLHTNSIIYCDLKPSNILMDENGRLKLGGFGLSRRLADINKTPLSSLPPVSRRLAACCYTRPHGLQTSKWGLRAPTWKQKPTEHHRVCGMSVGQARLALLLGARAVLRGRNPLHGLGHVGTGMRAVRVRNRTAAVPQQLLQPARAGHSQQGPRAPGR